MYSFTGRVFPPMRRPLHLILHHLAVHLNVSTGGNLPPQLSDAGCERLYLLRIIGRGSFTLPAIERPALRRKSAIYHEGSKVQLMENMTAALPFMDEDMRPFAERTLQKISPLTENEYAELAIFAADEV